LREARFTPVVTNLKPPRGYPRFKAWVAWPQPDPFLAIVGFAGQQTIEKAISAKFNFKKTPWQQELASLIAKLEKKPRIGALVALTHMDRDEDKELQGIIDRHWYKNGSVYVLGGHDHDIHWQESYRKSVLTKNLSNCRSITVIVLDKAGLALRSASLEALGTFRLVSKRFQVVLQDAVESLDGV
jgi:2',3'-cyclic-nucleotide 2'-phosphodiesterase (5'-nucleotidase family)